MQPTLEIHPQYNQEFNFSSDTEAAGCCCFWKAKPKAREIYAVNGQNQLVSKDKLKFRERVEALEKLSEILKMKFDDDPIENDKAFERLKMKVRFDTESGEPITDQRLAEIVEAIYELKKEIHGSDLSTWQ